MEVTCANCGRIFNKKPSHIKYAKDKGYNHYCNRNCQQMGMDKKQECVCANCGKPILKRVSEITKSKSKNVFCSKSCSCSFHNKTLRTKENNPNWKDGSGSYAYNIYNVYKQECAVCGFNKQKALEVHHIDFSRKNNNIDNLIILCANCHCLVHYDNLKISQDIKDMRKYKK